MGKDNHKTKKTKIEKISFSGGKIAEDDLAAVTGGHHDINDYYDPFRCNVGIPDGGKCRIRNVDARCRHLRIEHIPEFAAPEKYRYICDKGCFNYVSDIKLH